MQIILVEIRIDPFVGRGQKPAGRRRQSSITELRHWRSTAAATEPTGSHECGYAASAAATFVNGSMARTAVCARLEKGQQAVSAATSVGRTAVRRVEFTRSGEGGNGLPWYSRSGRRQTASGGSGIPKRRGHTPSNRRSRHWPGPKRPLCQSHAVRHVPRAPRWCFRHAGPQAVG
jgi:hypothetical protein